ncbi:hypothetical protein QDY71_10490 [Kingella negevensis]|nr:hypothetical protein [Kingella negevensis]MDK4680789.1 hypothetical protein [Kingella negevensis]MDK4681488.1 hypothetical protein [Kingella negevensis]MDK4684228.1 hypothetical protein [Kingella negevensis]MDK4691875.1 hypothetical protein [Kingella negevensis]MDK4692972.1 hypothetical protein [Kingella negevensis]
MKHDYIRKVANTLWLVVFLVLAAYTGQTQQRTADGNNAFDQMTYKLGSKLGIETNQRFAIVRVSVFEDKLAYGNKRGVYVIKDSDTGREFVGISGVGIAELGSDANPSVKREVEQ